MPQILNGEMLFSKAEVESALGVSSDEVDTLIQKRVLVSTEINRQTFYSLKRIARKVKVSGVRERLVHYVPHIVVGLIVAAYVWFDSEHGATPQHIRASTEHFDRQLQAFSEHTERQTDGLRAVLVENALISWQSAGRSEKQETYAALWKEFERLDGEGQWDVYTKLVDICVPPQGTKFWFYKGAGDPRSALAIQMWTAGWQPFKAHWYRQVSAEDADRLGRPDVRALVYLKGHLEDPQMQGDPLPLLAYRIDVVKDKTKSLPFYMGNYNLDCPQKGILVWTPTGFKHLSSKEEDAALAFNPHAVLGCREHGRKL